MHEEIREMERRYQAMQQQAEHDRAMVMQRCEQLEAYAREKDERINKEQ